MTGEFNLLLWALIRRLMLLACSEHFLEFQTDVSGEVAHDTLSALTASMLIL